MRRPHLSDFVPPVLLRRLVNRAETARHRFRASWNGRRSAPAKTRGTPRPARLPFETVERVAESIEGMTSPFSMKAMDALLSFQGEHGIAGHLVEIGVYKGRSAAVISAHVGERERFVLVDPVDYLAGAKTPFFATPEFVLSTSANFPRRVSDFPALEKSVRFLHVDSSHAYRATFEELRLIDRLLARDGIACLDDFANLNFSQILPALYKYLFTERTDLTVFLVTDEKGYLCRRPLFDFYAGFVLDRIVGEMLERGSGPVTIARTDADPEYSAIYLRSKLSPDEEDHYGEEHYRRFYEAP